MTPDDFKPNWMRILADLTKAGWSNRKVERHLGFGQSFCTPLKAGKQPLYHNGAAILALHKEVCGK
jgi:hypothetical protein